MKLTEEMKQEILNILKPKDGSIEAITTVEFQNLMGWSEDRTRKVLLDFKKSGLIDVVTVYREDVDGHISPRPGYILRIDKVVSTT